jgi:hypothetical protein
MTLKEKLPAVYHNILDELLDIEFPQEKIASCKNCILCQSDKSPYLEIKCCNYFPVLSNYLLGGILADTSGDLKFGQTKILEIIKSKKGVTPYGIFPDKSFKESQNKILNLDKLFSSKEDLALQKCPYLDNGNCSVWKYRENLCVTFFCSSIGGRSGQSFWNKLNELLKTTEHKLSQYTMIKLGFEFDEIITKPLSIKDFSIENETGKINENEYLELWKNWAGKELNFYLKSFEIVNEMNAKTFKEILGLDYSILTKSIENLSIEFTKNKFPEYLIFNDSTILERKENGDYVMKLKGKEHEIESVYYPFLKMFDGQKKTVEIIQFGYKILLGLNSLVDSLVKKEMLIPKN